MKILTLIGATALIALVAGLPSCTDPAQRMFQLPDGGDDDTETSAPDGDTDTDVDGDTDTDSDGDTDTDVDGDTDTDSDSDSDADSDVDSDADSDADTDTSCTTGETTCNGNYLYTCQNNSWNVVPPYDCGVLSCTVISPGNAECVSGPDADSDVDSDADSDTDIDADSDTDTDTDNDTDTDSDSDADSDSDSDSDSDTDIDGDTDTDSDGDSDTDSDADVDTGDPIDCSSDPDLAKHGAWLGCDPSTHADDMYGIQGGWYVFSDPGGSCASDEPDCDDNGCGFSGRTVGSGDYDNDWGCGMGIGLKSVPEDEEAGIPEQKFPYDGDATCFDMEIEGSSGGAQVRIGFTQFEDNEGKVSPFMTVGEIDGGWSGLVCFDTVECPAWEGIDCDLTGNNYDLQINVAGGDNDGNFDLKVVSFVPNSEGPIVNPPGQCPAMQGNGSSCLQFPEASVYANGKQYYVVGNAWGPGSGDDTQCISWDGTNFSITKQTASSGGDEPVSYPAAFIGKKGNLSTSDSGLPVGVSSFSSIDSGFHTNAGNVSGTFNAAWDIWTSSNSGGTTAEWFVMLWIENQGNKQPAGTAETNVTLEGYQWQVWTGGQGEGGGRYIAYVLQGGANSVDVDLKPFFDDAINNRGLPSNQYIINIQAGFEIWSGGSGLECECFWAEVK